MENIDDYESDKKAKAALADVNRRIDFILGQKYLDSFPIDDYDMDPLLESIEDCYSDEEISDRLIAIISVLIEVALNLDMNAGDPEKTEKLKMIAKKIISQKTLDAIIS